MSLEKILDKILEEARGEVERILSESRQKADDITRNAREQGELQAKTLLEQAEKQANLEASRLITQARLEKRIQILRCKKELIDDVLEKAFRDQKDDRIGLKRKIVMKDRELDEPIDQERLKLELRPLLEKDIAEVLKI